MSAKSVAVVGGTYHEVCLDPSSAQLWGSGLRASRILSALGANVSLVTCIDEDSTDELESVRALFNLVVRTAPRSHPMRYIYDSPIEHPRHVGVDTEGPQISAQADVVLGFGMSDASWSINAVFAVIDPQHAPVDRLLSTTAADHIALVLNEHEARKVTGESELPEAAAALLQGGVEVVAIKCGARGGYVYTNESQLMFGAIPTSRVDPIGSGDAFSAGFTYAWAVAGMDLASAAAYASKTAAVHSLAGAVGFNADLFSTLENPIAFHENKTKCVYLAGPFFDTGQRAMIRVAREALTHLGVQVFSPLDEVGPGGDEVALKDLAGLRESAAVLALLDGADAGTLFEVGWATNANIPVVGFAENAYDHAWTMLRGTNTPVFSDLATAVYQAAWLTAGSEEEL